MEKSPDEQPRKASERTVVNWDEFDRLTSAKGWTTDYRRAKELGIHQSHLINGRAGRFGAGAKLIDACIEAFGPESYPLLFRREVRT